MARKQAPAKQPTQREVTFAYGRVSTNEQTAENQRQEIAAAGFKVDGWYADEGISGATPAAERPQFQRMLASIRCHRETGQAVRLVVTKLDRLGRDAVDVQQTVRALEAIGVRTVVLQLGATDLTSAAGKLLLGVVAAVAEMERDLIRERTRAGLARTKAAGTRLGRPAKTTDEDRAVIRARLAAGESLSTIARDYGIARSTVSGMRGA